MALTLSHRRQAGLAPDTSCYYEVGLLSPPSSLLRYRLYDQDAFGASYKGSLCGLRLLEIGSSRSPHRPSVPAATRDLAPQRLTRS